MKGHNKEKSDVFGLPLVLVIFFVVLLVAIAFLASQAGLQGELRTAAEPSGATSCSNKGVPNAFLEVELTGKPGETRSKITGEAIQLAVDALHQQIRSASSSDAEKDLADGFCTLKANEAVNESRLLCDYPNITNDDGCLPKEVDESGGQYNPYSSAISTRVFSGGADCKDLDSHPIKVQWQCTGKAFLGCRGNLICLPSSPKPCKEKGGKFVLWASGLKERRGENKDVVKAEAIAETLISINDKAKAEGVSVPLSQSGVDKACRDKAGPTKVNCGTGCWFGYGEGQYTGIIPQASNEGEFVVKCTEVYVNTLEPSPSGTPLPKQWKCEASSSVDCEWVGACLDSNPSSSGSNLPSPS